MQIALTKTNCKIHQMLTLFRWHYEVAGSRRQV